MDDLTVCTGDLAPDAGAPDAGPPDVLEAPVVGYLENPFGDAGCTVIRDYDAHLNDTPAPRIT